MKAILTGFLMVFSVSVFASGEVYEETNYDFSCVESASSPSCETVVHTDSANTWAICEASVFGNDINGDKKHLKLHTQEFFYRERGDIKRFLQVNRIRREVRSEIDAQLKSVLENNTKCEVE